MSNSPYLPRFSDAGDIDEFVETLGRFERGEISPEDFRRYRLTRGVYGQRQEGEQMIRVKLPQGVAAPGALLAMAEVAERWGHGYANVTTRQNVQFHFVKLAESEAAMRVLHEGGVTTREACGNTVRNVTCCPFAGVHSRETFDVAPYGEAVTRFLLRAPWANSLPRKFKIALSCGPKDCAFGAINDVGLVGRVVEGRRGFRVLAAGGLSTTPENAVVFFDFIEAERLLDAVEAVVRVFDRHGNRENKHRARLKYVLRKMGRERFLAALREAYAEVTSRGGTPLDLGVVEVAPAPPAPSADAPDADRTAARGPGYLAWRAANTFTQVQPGYTTVISRHALGRVTPEHLRALARLCVEYGEGSVRTTIDQNLAIRFVPHHKLPALHAELSALGLANPGASTVSDVTTCPGAETCNLAVTASRQVGASITARLEGDASLAETLSLAKAAVIKVSGCPNSCGQHHIADIGWHGAVRKVGDRSAPVYQLHLGGGFDDQGARFGRQLIKIPARRVDEAVARLLRLYERDRAEAEEPSSFFARVTAESVNAVLGDLAELDANTPDEVFLDIGEDRGFKVSIGAGECAA
ncbi:MAG: nitrite/sulfite reductase [Polyangiales bacterium]